MKTQDEMRSKFEKLEDIASEIENSDGELYFCETEKRYKNHRVFQDAQTGFMNGAWYAFQERQKQIDQLMEVLESSFRIEKSLYGQVVALKSQVDILERILK